MAETSSATKLSFRTKSSGHHSKKFVSFVQFCNRIKKVVLKSWICFLLSSFKFFFSYFYPLVLHFSLMGLGEDGGCPKCADDLVLIFCDRKLKGRAVISFAADVPFFFSFFFKVIYGACLRAIPTQSSVYKNKNNPSLKLVASRLFAYTQMKSLLPSKF